MYVRNVKKSIWKDFMYSVNLNYSYITHEYLWSKEKNEHTYTFR